MKLLKLNFLILVLFFSVSVQSEYDSRDWKSGGGGQDWEPFRKIQRMGRTLVAILSEKKSIILVHVLAH